MWKKQVEHCVSKVAAQPNDEQKNEDEQVFVENDFDGFGFLPFVAVEQELFRGFDGKGREVDQLFVFAPAVVFRNFLKNVKSFLFSSIFNKPSLNKEKIIRKK